MLKRYLLQKIWLVKKFRLSQLSFFMFRYHKGSTYLPIFSISNFRGVSNIYLKMSTNYQLTDHLPPLPPSDLSSSYFLDLWQNNVKTTFQFLFSLEK